MKIRGLLPLGLLVLVVTTVTRADIQPELAGVAELPQANPAWVWVTDISYPNFVPGKAHLIDARQASFLGMITMGYGLSPLALPTHGREFYTVETHYDRTVRGKRFDLVGVYSPQTLELVHEIEIPGKRLSAVPMLSFVGLTDDDRFLLIYNFTPAQSVSLVDLESRRFVTEFDTAGCGLVLPAGKRRFLMLCSNGKLGDITFSDTGAVITKSYSAPVFDRKTEFLTEKAVRFGNRWLFVTNHGEIQPVEVTPDGVSVAERWPLFSDAELEQGWRIGGQQHLAVHHKNGTLYAAVHQGGEDSHKDPGSQVFVYDVERRARVASVTLERAASAIQVTQDAAPLLMTTNAYPAIVDVYDARSGKFLHEIGDAAISPMTLQTHVAP